MDICVNFIIELQFHPTVACLISTVERGLMIMMSHVQQALVMIESTHVVGFSSQREGMSIITVVWMPYNLSDNSYLSLKQPFVIFVNKIVFLWQILFCIMNVYICVFHFLFVLVVIFLILPILFYECTLLNFMGVQAQLSNLFPLTMISGIKLLLYDLMM